MSLNRYNIFDLIGKHQSKYEHAIITTFTFDYLFFEERVMRALRSANIRNVNVLVDANFLEQAIERLDETAFNSQRLYSLIPIHVSGIFHPKIMLLIGKNEGLLVVGSGNFTSSGISTNDEVWGAFHLDHIGSKNAPLFDAAWNYIQRFTKQALGFHEQKIKWITQKAPWLSELTNVPAGFSELSSHESIAFVANALDNSTLAQLKTLLPTGKVRCLTVVSPYFDAKGQGLKDLREAFDIQAFHCITDVEFGLLPYSIDTQLHDEIIFLDWQDCIKDFERKYNRLHAKIFHFAYEDGHEYLLIGSANATRAGLGPLVGDAFNQEAGLLLHRVPGGNYLKDLGIQVDKSKAISVQGRKPRLASHGDNLERKAYQNRILYAQRLGNQLTLECKEPVDTTVQLGVHSRPLDPAVMYPLQSSRIELTVVLDQPNLPQVAALYRGVKRISPFAYIDDIGLLSKTNPDARQAAISDVIDALKEDPNAEVYADLLKYQEYDWLDEEDDYSSVTKKLSFRNSTISSKTAQTFERIDETAFNNLSSVQLREAALLNDPSTQIADFLNLISKGLVVPKGALESVEQKLIMAKEAGLDDQDGQGLNFQGISIGGEKDAQALDKHLDQLEKRFRGALEDFFKSGNLANSPNRPISMKELNNVMAAIDLSIIFNGKKYIKKYGRFRLKNEKQIQLELVNLVKKYQLKPTADSNKSEPGYIFYNLESTFIEAFQKDITSKSLDSLFFQEAKGKFRLQNEMKIHLVLEKLIKKYRLKGSINFDTSKLDYIFYDVDSMLIEDFQKEIETRGLKSIFLQEEDSFQNIEYDYIFEGVIKGMYVNGLKHNLLNVLGSFLLCANRKTGFKEYGYQPAFNRVQLLRLDIFKKGVFLLLNLHWNEKEVLYRDLMLLDLLHNIYPTALQMEGLPTIKEEINEYYGRSQKKHPHFEANLEWFTTRLVPQYLRWRSIFDSDDKSSIQKNINSVSNGEWVYQSRIGFSCVHRQGAGYFELQKAGFRWDDAKGIHVQKLEYHLKTILVFS